MREHAAVAPSKAAGAVQKFRQRADCSYDIDSRIPHPLEAAAEPP